MNRVIFTPLAKQDYENLVPVLYDGGYFSNKEDAHKYVDELVNDIKVNLPMRAKRKVPDFFSDRYGEGLYYAVFPKNRRTHWYVFFKMYQMNSETYYQIRYIDNNHSIARFLRHFD